MSDVKAADLPEGSVVIDDNRHLVWTATPPPSRPESGRWTVSGSPSRITDRQVDAALLHTAVVLRHGYGDEGES